MTRIMTLPEIERLQLQRMPFDKLEKECLARGIRANDAVADVVPYLRKMRSRFDSQGRRTDLGYSQGKTWTEWCEQYRDQTGMAPRTVRALLMEPKQPLAELPEVPVGTVEILPPELEAVPTTQPTVPDPVATKSVPDSDPTAESDIVMPFKPTTALEAGSRIAIRGATYEIEEVEEVERFHPDADFRLGDNCEVHSVVLWLYDSN
jgi:hypothetical protein